MTVLPRTRLERVKHRKLIILIVPFLLMWTAAPASAACTDSPQPGISWVRCLLNERDFSAVDLTGAVLRDSSFYRTNLEDAQMGGVDARRAKFVSALMAGANLDSAVLRDADFTSADLAGADLSGADLRGARLYQTTLKDADLSGARLEDADLLRADLSGALWTDGVRRCAAKSIGLCR